MLRARKTVYWPGMEKSLQAITDACPQCREHAKSHTKEPLIPVLIPDYPMQYVASDLFEYEGYKYLVYACRLTGWVELGFFPTTTKSTDVINIVRDFFHRWGVSEEIAIDGASNLSSPEFRTFLDDWSARYRLSSAYYPQSNGRAEAAVKSMKRLIRGNTGHRGSLDTNAIAQGLLQYRNTPLQNAAGKSPAQLALGRELRDMLPLPTHRYRISDHWKDFLISREHLMSNANDRIATEWNKSAKMLPAINNGIDVVCRNPKSTR